MLVEPVLGLGDKERFGISTFYALSAEEKVGSGMKGFCAQGLLA